MSTSPKWNSPSGVAYMRRHLIPGLLSPIQLRIWWPLRVQCNSVGQRLTSTAGMIFLAYPPETDFHGAWRSDRLRATSGCEQMRELASRRSCAYTVEALLDRCEALIDERFVLSIGENVGPVVFDGLANQFAHVERINAVVDPFLQCLDEIGAGSFYRRSVADSPS